MLNEVGGILINRGMSRLITPFLSPVIGPVGADDRVIPVLKKR